MLFPLLQIHLQVPTQTVKHERGDCSRQYTEKLGFKDGVFTLLHEQGQAPCTGIKKPNRIVSYVYLRAWHHFSGYICMKHVLTLTLELSTVSNGGISESVKLASWAGSEGTVSARHQSGPGWSPAPPYLFAVTRSTGGFSKRLSGLPHKTGSNKQLIQFQGEIMRYM